MASPRHAGATNQEQKAEAAIGCRIGVCQTTFGEAGLRLLDNGYQPLPIAPAEKRPEVSRWSSISIDAATVKRWAQRYKTCGIGLRTGALVGVDIDIIDPDLAYRVDRLVRDRLGDAPTRFGLWPKRLLPYRTDQPFRKIVCGWVKGAQVEFLGCGQQFVTFGIHPNTGQSYYWVGDTPLDVPFESLPIVDRAMLETLKVEIEALLPRAPRGRSASGTRAQTTVPASGPTRDRRGQVVDGRDGYLSKIAFHAVHEVAEAGDAALNIERLTALVWERFAATADLERPASDGRSYSPAHARRKVADKLRLLADGRLPLRASPAVEVDYHAPSLTAAEARTHLETLITGACARIEASHERRASPAPRIGIKATVGLGKSTGVRRELLEMRARMIAAGTSSRLLVLTPSHALAEEAAAAWRAESVSVAVLRGYEAVDPRTRTPMCRDVPAVKAAIDARLNVHETACAAGERRCALIDSCLKQRNRAEVATANIVFAAHRALFTGFGAEAGSIAAIVIDEGHWSSAIREPIVISLDAFAHELLLGHTLGRRGSGEAAADLHDLRSRAAAAFPECGPVARSRLLAVGLDDATCRLAASLEAKRLLDPELYPGMPTEERRRAGVQAAINALNYNFIEFWEAMAGLAAGTAEHDGQLFVRNNEVLLNTLRPIHPTLRYKPILHLDATLRPALAEAVLPGLEVHEIEAAAPHMTLRLVAGSFGKSKLCPEPNLDQGEAQRRSNRLREVVEYVAWQARRAAPGRVLVITYQACEAAFKAIPNVDTGHFNAIAGLDAYRDVRLLVVVGRPLPSDSALAPLTGALFRHLPEGDYGREPRGVRMRDGSIRAVQVTTHTDEKAELLRAAICDDEVLQAIGRGRGVNRTGANPLEVHVLADVALPLVHDEIVAWEEVEPDIVQRMLLEGVAVDSPADAARLFPTLLANEKQAQKTFERVGFKRHFPMNNSYREMSLKSAAYRRGGRGRSWQRAWWIDGSADDARRTLEAAFGALAEWLPNV